MQLQFVKYQGAGNDFVVVDTRGFSSQQLDVFTQKTVSLLCNRRFGVGADGMMTLSNDVKGADFYMRYWNADGAESTMCGNGGRCIAYFAHSLGLGGGHTLTFNSVDGLHTAELLSANSVRLKMVDVSGVECIDGGFLLNTGSPHYVEFVPSVQQVDVEHRGAKLRHSFEGGVNVNFVELTGEGSFRIRTFERGVEAETLACGTGATAAAIAVNRALQEYCCHFDIQAEGGALEVDFIRRGLSYESVFLSGPAVEVFRGIIEI
ncbi:MAG: diaminopimelate epimerase [Mucinivorans sp.]